MASPALFVIRPETFLAIADAVARTRTGPCLRIDFSTVFEHVDDDAPVRCVLFVAVFVGELRLFGKQENGVELATPLHIALETEGAARISWRENILIFM